MAEVIGKIFVVPLDGQEHLVRARSARGAAKGLVAMRTEGAFKGVRVASQNDLVNLLSSGGNVIDVTSRESANEPEPGEPEASGDAATSGGDSNQAGAAPCPQASMLM
jgi:hypothetical protein